MINVKYLIIGAGISGLTFASQKAQQDYIILERDSVVGGLCQSFYDKGFVWDVAGHFFHFHSDKTKKYYENLMSGKIQVKAKKCAKVYYGGKYINAPFQYNIHQLPVNEFIECLTDLYYADDVEKNISFEDFVCTKYGNGIAKKFLIPYNEKLYACKMNQLEKSSMGCFLPNLDFAMLMSFYRGFKGETYNDIFSYPVNGCVEFINSLMETIDQQRIHLNEKVNRIDTENKIVYTPKGAYKYEYLINTADVSSIMNMIGYKGVEHLNYNKVLVFNMGFNKPSIDKEVSWAYYPSDEIFYRVGFYNNIVGTQRLSIYVEIGYKSNTDIDIKKALDRTLQDLRKVNIIDDHELIAYKPYIINPGYVHITSQGKKITDNFISEMEKKNVFMIGRYARWEYSAMDDSIEQAFELSKKV